MAMVVGSGKKGSGKASKMELLFFWVEDSVDKQ